MALHTFCLQLQYENHGFIQGFIERDFALRSAFKAPDRLQPVSLKETELVCLFSPSQVPHRRISLEYTLWIGLQNSSLEISSTDESLCQVILYTWAWIVPAQAMEMNVLLTAWF